MHFSNKIILVTGGAGFIGSNLVDALLAIGAKKVKVLDNFSTGSRKNLKNAKKYSNFQLIEGDICCLKTCQRACKNVHIVYHQAAIASVQKSIEDPGATNAVNIAGTLNMLMAASHEKVERFIYASSAAIYGTDPTTPKVEFMQRQYASPYALSKGVTEDYASLWAFLSKEMTCIGLRYFNVYGPRQDPKSPYSGVITIFIDKIKSGESVTIFGDGSQTRDFVHVKDVVQANILAGTVLIKSGESKVYNVGSGEAVSLLQLIDIIKEIFGKEIKIAFENARPGDIKDSFSDVNKIQRGMKYKPRISLQSGLEELIATSF